MFRPGCSSSSTSQDLTTERASRSDSRGPAAERSISQLGAFGRPSRSARSESTEHVGRTSCRATQPCTCAIARQVGRSASLRCPRPCLVESCDGRTRAVRRSLHCVRCVGTGIRGRSSARLLPVASDETMSDKAVRSAAKHRDENGIVFDVRWPVSNRLFRSTTESVMCVGAERGEFEGLVWPRVTV